MVLGIFSARDGVRTALTAMFVLPFWTGGNTVVTATIEVHGSGTTNPSKCFWSLMEEMVDQAKVPLRMTYRAVGSSTGIYEFMGTNNTATNSFLPYNDFGAGDIPIPTESYENLVGAGVEVVHLPFALGAINFFHSVRAPVNVGDDTVNVPQRLNLTSCQLAQIFDRKIVKWDDERLADNNPNLVVPFTGFPIKVARRVKGSSSTASITKYLHTTCPEDWPEEKVGAEIDWDEDTMQCEGSSGMASCIATNPGTIGYVDAGHGVSAPGLTEVELRNADGYFLSTAEAGLNGIGRAAVEALKAGILPEDATANFGEVELLNMPGQNTWPIVAMTYVFVRTDLHAVMADRYESASQSLLVHFLNRLYDPKVMVQCEEFGFIPVPTKVRDVGLDGISKLKIDDDAPEWSTEIDTAPGVGQGDYVLSSKRKTSSQLRLSSLELEGARMSEGMVFLTQQQDAIAYQIGVNGNGDYVSEGESRVEVEESGYASEPMYDDGVNTIAGSLTSAVLSDVDRSMIQAALGLGAVSMLLWCFTLVFLCLRKCGIF